MAGTIWGPRWYGKTAWALPDDLWGTLIAAQRLAHLNLAGLYTLPTQLVSLPGAAIILVPAIAVADLAGLQLTVPHAHGAYPSLWLFAGPYQVVISAVVAVRRRRDRRAPGRDQAPALLPGRGQCHRPVERHHPVGAPGRRRGDRAAAVRHPGAGRLKTARSAWLAGAAVAVQPLVLLAFPLLVAVVEPSRRPGYVARAAAPGALLLAAAAAANWTATVHAVTSQPNYPTIDHPTPWIYLAPHIADGQVAAGPGRILAIVAALGCALVLARRWRAVRAAGRWGPGALTELLWWTAVTLALRSVFEPVMVAYYLWPPLAVALAAAARDWSRLLPAGCTAVGLTFFSQVQWHNPWSWWTPIVAGLALTLYFARPRSRRSRPAPQVLPEPGEQLAADGAP